MTAFANQVLVSLDLETTGTDILADRIVELALVRREGAHTHVTATRVNPGIPIPAAATKIHGIADADVADAPRFATLVPAILAAFKDAHAVVAFNGRQFDLPLLEMELRRAGHQGPLTWEGMPLLDALEVHRWLIPGNLPGAVRYWCGRDHVGAHGALADATAALDVLVAQVGSSELLDGVTPAALEALVLPEDAASWVDPTGKLKRDAAGDVCIAFGKHQGVRLRDVDGGYLDWVLGKSFHPRVMEEVRAEQVRRAGMRRSA